jgi:DNA-directed RNA polymerase specialized sigma24 family protein
MELGLNADTFANLLDFLSTDREQAGAKYEDLRRTLIRFFEWRGAPFPEEHADETFNRVARKLAEGVKIKSVSGYCYEVARLVCLEAFKGHDSKRSPLEDIANEPTTSSTTDDASEKELRLTCLDNCLGGLANDSRELILQYYQDESSGLIDHRKALAQRIGLRRDALANRAQRIRDKLEQCVIACLRKKRAI